MRPPCTQWGLATSSSLCPPTPAQSSRQTDPHPSRAALTIATIPTLTASGRLSHASTTSRSSSGSSDTHMTHFWCKSVSFWRFLVFWFCSDEEGGDSASVCFCRVCVLSVWNLCSGEEMPKGGFEPPRPVRHHPLKMACLPSSTTSAWLDMGPY